MHAIRIPENHMYHKKIRKTFIYYSNHEAKNKMHIFKFLTFVKKYICTIKYERHFFKVRYVKIIEDFTL